MKHIDLNCDMGESFGAWRMGADAEVMPWVSSVNVACGFHAGDPLTMRHTVQAAVAAGVAVGAHVGLPDLAGFGRRTMAITAAEAHAMTVVQIGALAAVARSCGTTLTHMKPHGALYHMVEKQPELADALVRAVADTDPSLAVVGRASGVLVARAAAAGIPVRHEGFVDRRYNADGTLAPRGLAGAVIEDIDAAVAQALGLALHGQVTTLDGQQIPVAADTLCVHGDRDQAGAFAHALREALDGAGVRVGRAIAEHAS